jgi:hypothetical protein
LNLIGCNDQQDPIITDISVSSSIPLLTWENETDLMNKTNQVLIFDYGMASEEEVRKHQTLNTDSTQFITRISFKEEFKNTYKDSDISNNTAIITLEKALPPSNAVVLKADGPGNTYELITSVFAPGFDPVESPDCNHPEFGRHIQESYDTDLKSNVFEFHIHTSPDNDRCINFDRQRNEIKTYDKSPENLLATQGETVIYSWKFKLPSGFQSSPNFTHIHQLKSVGGNYSSMPMYTLTTRNSNPDRLELRYAEVDRQITLHETELTPLIDTWIEAFVSITYGNSGSYQIVLKEISSGSVLFEYSSSSIRNWRENAAFVRPKWGIYRSLNNPHFLRDETVFFADFSIDER